MRGGPKLAVIASMAVVLALTIVVLAWQRIPFWLAAATAEHRPDLLADAAWRDPRSAAKFNGRFHAGVPEAELLAWLQSNRFTIDRADAVATRLVEAFPCNEEVEVRWSASAGQISTATANVAEAGCL